MAKRKTKIEETAEEREARMAKLERLEVAVQRVEETLQLASDLETDSRLRWDSSANALLIPVEHVEALIKKIEELEKARKS